MRYVGIDYYNRSGAFKRVKEVKEIEYPENVDCNQLEKYFKNDDQKVMIMDVRETHEVDLFGPFKPLNDSIEVKQMTL